MHIQEERTARVEDQGWQAPSPVIRLHAHDDVVIARHQLVAGTRVAEENVIVAGLIPAGHKMATRAIAKGDPVHRYNQIIGIAKQDIRAGQHVHTQNLAMTEYARDYAFCVDARPTEYDGVLADRLHLAQLPVGVEDLLADRVPPLGFFDATSQSSAFIRHECVRACSTRSLATSSGASSGSQCDRPSSTS